MNGDVTGEQRVGLSLRLTTRDRCWPAAAPALGAVLFAAVVFLARSNDVPIVTLASDLSQLLAAGLACTGTTWAAARTIAGPRRSWISFAVGTGAWACGQGIWCWYELVRHTSTPFPAAADVGFLAFPIAVGTGLLLFPSRESARNRLRWLLDGVIATNALIVISWATVLRYVAHGTHTSGFGFVVSLAYPLGDVLIITVAISCLSRTTMCVSQIVMLSTALASFTLSDSLFAYLTARGSYATGGPVDLGWIGAMLAVAALGAQAAEHPGTVPPTYPAHAVQTPSRRPLHATMLPYLPVLVALGVVGYRRAQGHELDLMEWPFLLCMIVTVLLRQWSTLRQNRILLDEVDAGYQKLRKQAFTDQLTGLANRALFLNRLEHAIELHNRDLRPVCVLLCDLDDFKTVNDMLGHVAGDELLIRVSARLLGALRSGDTVARVAGDEFGVLIEDGADSAIIGARIVDAMRAPFVLQNRSISVGVCVGITEIDAESATPTVDALLTEADIAMYSAKHSGTSRLARYVPGMTLPNADDLYLREPLGIAVRNQMIDVAYQPIVALATGEVVGLEALARWTHEGTAISPEQFIPMAARAGLLEALTDQVLEQACGHLVRWSQLLGHHCLRLNVNVTPGMIVDDAFPDRVAGVVGRHALSPGQLVLEVTEEALLDDPAATRAVTRRLQDLGVLLALDDFGKGYSALVHVQQLPLYALKIDMAFIAHIDRDPAAERFIRAVLALARELGLRVVAEGVERPGQADVLRRLGCPLAQGYLFSRPMPATEVANFMRRAVGGSGQRLVQKSLR